jgi:hypothetical protein
MRFSYEQYHAFSAPLEGRVPYMYCDCLGLITTGVGNLINTLAQAEALPWLLADGTPAPLEAVRADWHKLHDNAQYYGKFSWRVYAKTMRCHLSEDAVDALVQRTLVTNEAMFRKRWSAWDLFPADAQLAIMSQAWAVGAAFWAKFPNLDRCVSAQDWDGCAASCKIRDGFDTPSKADDNPGVVPRNAKDKFCFHNAALVAHATLDPARLYWPDVAPSFVNAAARAEAEAAQRDAVIRLAAYQALEFTAPLPGAGRATIDYEATE